METFTIENNLEERVFEKTPTPKKSRGGVLKPSSKNIKKQKNLWLSLESIEILEKLRVYYSKNISDTLDLIIKSSSEQIKKKKDQIAVLKDNDYDELFAQQSKFTQELFDEVETLKEALTNFPVVEKSESENTETENMAKQILALQSELQKEKNKQNDFYRAYYNLSQAKTKEEQSQLKEVVVNVIKNAIEERSE